MLLHGEGGVKWCICQLKYKMTLTVKIMVIRTEKRLLAYYDTQFVNSTALHLFVQKLLCRHDFARGVPTSKITKCP